MKCTIHLDIVKIVRHQVRNFMLVFYPMLMLKEHAKGKQVGERWELGCSKEMQERLTFGCHKFEIFYENMVYKAQIWEGYCIT